MKYSFIIFLIIYLIFKIEKNKEEELALTKIKLNTALKTILKVEDFFLHYKQQPTVNGK